MKNNKAFTLIEVMVSIIIIGISLTTLILVVSNNSKVSRNMKTKYNIITDVNELMDIYSSNPVQFYTSLKLTKKYNNAVILENMTECYIYYNDNYSLILDKSTKNYLKLNYQINNDKTMYTLIIMVSYNGQYLNLFNDGFSTSRSIYV